LVIAAPGHAEFGKYVLLVKPQTENDLRDRDLLIKAAIPVRELNI
jgi:hypothetical protein